MTEDLKAWNIHANNAHIYNQPVRKKALRTAMKSPTHGNCGQVAQNRYVTKKVISFKGK